MSGFSKDGSVAVYGNTGQVSVELQGADELQDFYGGMGWTEEISWAHVDKKEGDEWVTFAVFDEDMLSGDSDSDEDM